MFYAIKSLAETSVCPAEPWTAVGAKDRPSNKSIPKDDFIKWAQQPTTQHCFFSPVEGLDVNSRVGSANPPRKLHGLVADYDANITDEMIADMKAIVKPNWISRTYQNGVRCVWIFEDAIPVSSHIFLAHFLKQLQKKLKLERMLPGLDEVAFRSYHMYYELGTDWKPVNVAPVPRNTVWKWLYDCGKNYRWSEEDSETPEVPLDKVHEEVERQFPGKWVGAFDDGCRGTRFWDPAATNPTAAVVRATGMQCFSGDRSFISWGELLGKKFIEEYEANRIGAILDRFFYDGRMYWKKMPEGSWHAISKEDFRLELKVKYGLSPYTKRREISSEVDKATFAVQEHKLVAAALPFVHQPEGFIVHDGVRYLNISNCQCMAPSDQPSNTWGDGFPWVAEFLSNLLDPEDQLMYLLSWWKRFYVSSLAQEPLAGQALFFVGDVEVGKTLLSTGIIPMTVGGFSDASSYLLGEDKFTSHVLSQPIMCVDDTAPASDARKFARYSSMVKKLVANSHQLYEAKFRDAGMIKWMGRVVVTCNMDPESIKVLPNLDMSILDKICLFKCGTRRMKFPERYEITRILREELPHFCRFLKDWEVPEECSAATRFGVKSHHANELIETAVQSSPVYSFYELLCTFIDSYRETAPPGVTSWQGNATKLLTELISHPEIGGLASRLNGPQVSTYLGQLKGKGFPIAQVRTQYNRIWEIPFDLEEHGIKATGGDELLDEVAV